MSTKFPGKIKRGAEGQHPAGSFNYAGLTGHLRHFMFQSRPQNSSQHNKVMIIIPFKWPAD